MKELYLANTISVITILLILGMLAFIVYAIKNGTYIFKWGRLIVLLIVVGIAISALSAVRDAYMMPDAVFLVNSWQSSICSIAGGAVILTGIISIFIKKQHGKRYCFNIISFLFIIQVLVVEISRPILMTVGTI
ncbi:MAG: hypothetical protein ACYCYI_04070 [Saccharofermentanales bacterium]